MRDIPIQVLLSFPTPNYTNPQTQGTSLIIVNAVFAGLVVFAVTLRLYTRIFLKRWLGSDDFFIVIAAVFTLGLNIAVILANAKFYWNRHIWDVPIDKLTGVGKIAMAAKVLFTAASFFTRTSLLCFYYRLSGDTGLKRYRWVMHLAMAFNISIFLTFVPLAIFQCSPIKAYWTFPAEGKCIDEGKATLAAGVITCFADLLITVLPIPMIMKLKMPLKQRLGVALLLGLGLIVTIAGIIRTYFIWKSLIDSYDETWFAYPLWICAAVEIDLAVICACAPTIRPLLIKLTKPLITSVTSLYSKGSRTGYSLTKLGVLSSGVSAPTALSGNTATNTNTDYELEKIAGNVDIEERSEVGKPKRKWSKTWKRGDAEGLREPTSPTRLAILESHSFEVRHENRQQAVGRPSQDSYIRLDDTSSDLRNQWLDHKRSPAEKMFGHRHHEPTPRTSLRAPELAPALRTPTPLSPFSHSFVDGQSSVDGRTQTNRETTRSPNQDSFYISEASNDGDNTSESERVTEWPLRPATASSKAELRGDETRWDIELNPFQQITGDNTPRAVTSGGIFDHARWGNDAKLSEEIHPHKRSTNEQRSNSLREQSRGIARIL